ncbi:LacI family DNA-binding transcriptional regulator [Coraliomargarita sp. SDUM461003]|uniref:LacI family DNA-binding transcriptional regulator n=1 Tax=Thalassobacterium maritimum TaxID=3041265 RepID=A0ABU1AQF7_9BACT|nr:LacI family DNA-binding transcriptional regulator [Coraliomargarita sp. SDUM461003]MDQ8206380.1 LacI family DNA-binding transcriptional regulator [Coraliomargarita sp. SDUM461003]
MRAIAEQAGVSRMTVSKALRGVAGVSNKNRERIQQIAEELGYVPDPNVSMAMAAVAKTRSADGERLAFLTTHDSEHGWKRFSHIVGCFEGARARANALGFELEPFWALQPRTDMSKMLFARGINGVLIAPTGENLLLEGQRCIDMDWKHFSVVAVDELLDSPRMTSVRHNHFTSMFEVLYRLESLGYKRIGLSLSRLTEARNRHRWTGAYLLWLKNCLEGHEIPFFLHGEEDESQAYKAWVETNQIDAVIGLPADFTLLQKAGFKCPEELGFALLDRLEVPDVELEFSGIDQKAHFLGETAINAMVGLMNTRTKGVPDSPVKLVCEGLWIEGATTRRVGPAVSDRSLYNMALMQ